MNENIDSVPDYMTDSSLMEFGKRKTFSICLDSVILEEPKFINAVRAFEALHRNEMEEKKIPVEVERMKALYPEVSFKDEKFIELRYPEFLAFCREELKRQYSDVTYSGRVEFELAFIKFSELVNRVVAKTEPVKVMYMVKPGRADLIATVWLKKYGDELHKTNPEIAAKLFEWSDELKREIIKLSKEESYVNQIIEELEHDRSGN